MNTNTAGFTSKKHSCVIIDDDPLIIELIEAYVVDTPSLELLASFSSVFEAMEFFQQNPQVDFLFIDIEMDGLSGIEAAKKLRDLVRYLIFVTGHQKYALQAYQVHADQYLLKPVNYQKFTSCVNDLLLKDAKS